MKYKVKHNLRESFPHILIAEVGQQIGSPYSASQVKVKHKAKEQRETQKKVKSNSKFVKPFAQQLIVLVSIV